MLSGEYPYNASTVSLIYQKIQNKDPKFPKDKWEHISDEAKDLILKMLNRYPKLRITFEDCLEHKWFELHPHKPNESTDSSHGYVEVVDSLKKYSCLTVLKKEAMSVFVKALK